MKKNYKFYVSIIIVIIVLFAYLKYDSEKAIDKCIKETGDSFTCRYGLSK